MQWPAHASGSPAAPPAGERALRDTHERMVAAAAAALPDWSDDELRTLAAQLDRLRDDFAAEVAR